MVCSGETSRVAELVVMTMVQSVAKAISWRSCTNSLKA